MNVAEYCIFNTKSFTTISSFLDHIICVLDNNKHKTDSITSELIDLNLFNDIIKVVSDGSANIYFGKTLRDIKCVIMDSNYLREHQFFIKYKGPRKLNIFEINLPHSSIFEQDYSTIQDILTAMKTHLQGLENYFSELERIDRFCTVMEPLGATFKDEYRRIILEEHTWLHVEIASDGLAKNIHLVGEASLYTEKLQEGLLAWDHDKDVVENVMMIFDIYNFPAGPVVVPDVEMDSQIVEVEEVQQREGSLCCICLSSRLPNETILPQPLCQNPSCGAKFHRRCLYEWLISGSSSSLTPALGMVRGLCPACHEPIVCNDRDS